MARARARDRAGASSVSSDPSARPCAPCRLWRPRRWPVASHVTRPLPGRSAYRSNDRGTTDTTRLACWSDTDGRARRKDHRPYRYTGGRPRLREGLPLGVDRDDAFRQSSNHQLEQSSRHEAALRTPERASRRKVSEVGERGRYRCARVASVDGRLGSTVARLLIAYSLLALSAVSSGRPTLTLRGCRDAPE